MNPTKETYLSYQQAKSLVQTLKLTSPLEWEEICKTGNKPDTLPSDPEYIYGRTGEWRDWNDWLGIPADDTSLGYLPYQEARAFVHKLNLKKQRKWQFYRRMGRVPQNIPIDPEIFYTKTGDWRDWKDWLGS